MIRRFLPLLLAFSTVLPAALAQTISKIKTKNTSAAPAAYPDAARYPLSQYPFYQVPLVLRASAWVAVAAPPVPAA